MELKNRSDLHLARKVWHATSVFLMYLAYRMLPDKVSLALLILAWFLFVPMDFMRLKIPAMNDGLMHFFKPILRKSEVNKLAGTTYLLTGVLIVDLFFRREVVSLTFLFLAFADPVASFFGILYGKDKIFGHKSLQGFVAAFVVCALLTGLFVYFGMGSRDFFLIISLLGGLIGALAELIPIAKTDDNLTLPLISATGLSLLFYFFGI